MKHKKQISNASIRRAKLLFYFCLLPLASCLLPSLPLLPSVSGQGLSSAHPARESARRGEELRRKWDLAAAEAAFREAVRLDPGSREASVGLARIARARFDYAEAIGLLDRAARLHPTSAEVLAEYGAIYLAAEEPRRALDYFEKAARLEPNSNAVALGRAGVDLLERDYRNAEARVRRHLADNPRSARALDLLARVMLENNNTREAARAAEQAIRLDAFDTDGLYALAFARATERKPKEARALAERVIALDPMNAGARRLLSQYLDGRAGLDQKVRRGCARAIRARPRAKAGRATLGSAREVRSRALALEPRYYRALDSDGRRLAQGGRVRKGRDWPRAAAIEVDPEGALAHLELSYACHGMQERARIR